jgi:hypothetical protein
MVNQSPQSKLLDKAQLSWAFTFKGFLTQTKNTTKVLFQLSRNGIIAVLKKHITRANHHGITIIYK